MKELLTCFVLGVLSSIATAAPPQDVAHTISVENFGDMYVHKKKCVPKKNGGSYEEGFGVSFFGTKLVLKDRFYLLAVMQENNLDLSMMLKSDGPVLAFASTHRDSSGVISFDSLFKFSHSLEGNSSVFAPLLFSEGKNTVYHVSKNHEGFFVETIMDNGERISKYFGRLSNDGDGYFQVLFKPAVDCDFLIFSP